MNPSIFQFIVLVLLLALGLGVGVLILFAILIAKATLKTWQAMEYILQNVTKNIPSTKTQVKSDSDLGAVSNSSVRIE